MNNVRNRVFGIAIAAITTIAFNQAAGAQVGGSPASGSIGASGANAGQQNNSDQYTTNTGANKLTQYQQYILPTDQSALTSTQHSYQNTPNLTPSAYSTTNGMSITSTGSLAPNSVNMAPYPSGMFNYGFNNGSAPQQFMYQSKGGPGLPTVSTGSVDLNTVDCPFIAPVGDNSPANGMGPQPLTSTPPTQTPQQASESQSVQQALQNLGNFFGMPF